MNAMFRIATLIVLLTPLLCRADSKSIKEVRLKAVDKKRERKLPLKVYYTDKKSQPVILFSHGLGGSCENNSYLGKHWAAAGYVAVFVQHPGSDNEVWKSAPRGKRLAALKAAASARSLRQRIGDIPFVIDQLEIWNKQDGHVLKGRLDLKQIGMSGHSFGAVTTLAVAGRKYPFNRSFPEKRITAFLAMSPQPGKGLPASKSFGHLKKPILCMTGTRDGSPLDPTLKPSKRREVYSALPDGDKYQLVLDGAEHSAFGDSRRRNQRRNPKHHPAIQKISLQFWNAYLKGDDKSRKWLRSKKVLVDSGLGRTDVWEWK